MSKGRRRTVRRSHGAALAAGAYAVGRTDWKLYVEGWLRLGALDCDESSGRGSALWAEQRTASMAMSSS